MSRVGEARTWYVEAAWARTSSDDAGRPLLAELARLRAERDRLLTLVARLSEHLELVCDYLHEETSAGDGIREEHASGYEAARALLREVAEDAERGGDVMVADSEERDAARAGAASMLEAALRDLDAHHMLTCTDDRPTVTPSVPPCGECVRCRARALVTPPTSEEGER